MEPEGFIRTVGKRWFVILLCAIIGVGVAAGVARAITPQYAASATLFLKVEQTGASLYERSQFGLARIQSYPELVTSPELLDAVISDLKLDETPAELASQLSATSPTGTVLLEITAQSPDPATAAKIANAAAGEVAAIVDKLENSSASKTSSVTLNLTLPAQAPTVADSPKITIVLGLGLIVGLAIGLLAALLLGRFDTGMRSPDDVRRRSGLPVIGQLPPRLARDPSSSGDEVSLALSETTANIRAIFGGSFPALLSLVPIGDSSMRPGTRVGLARTLAATGRNVLLVETDQASQRDARLDVPPNSAGLSEVLAGSRTLAHSIVSPTSESFDILPTGSELAPRTSFTAERRAESVLGEIAGQFDVAVIQVTSEGRPVSIDVIAPALQGALLVVTYARTSAHSLRAEIARVRALGIEPVGVVMTAVPRWKRTQLLETWEPSDIVELSSAATTASVTEPVVEKTPAVDETKPAAPRPTGRKPRRSPAPRPSVVASEPSSDSPPLTMDEVIAGTAQFEDSAQNEDAVPSEGAAQSEGAEHSDGAVHEDQSDAGENHSDDANRESDQFAENESMR